LSRAAAAAAGEGEGLVFPNPRGGHFWNSTWSYYWHQIRAAAGRPGMHFHELRHFAATRLLEGGLDYIDVAVQMGHRDGGDLVRTTYGHPSERRALGRVRQVLDTTREDER
jgi:integrase